MSKLEFWSLIEILVNNLNFGQSLFLNVTPYLKGTTTINGNRAARTDTIMNSEKYVIGKILYENVPQVFDRPVLFDLKIEFLGNISATYPTLATVPFYNDEGDPIVSWSKPCDFHNDAVFRKFRTCFLQNLAKLFIFSNDELHFIFKT